MRRDRLSLSAKLSLITALLICSSLVRLVVALHVLAKVETTGAELTLLQEAQRRSQNADMLHDALRDSVLNLLLKDAEESDAKAGGLPREVFDTADQLHGEMSRLGGMALSPELKVLTEETHGVVTNFIAQAEQVASLATVQRALAMKRLVPLDASFATARPPSRIRPKRSERRARSPRRPARAPATRRGSGASCRAS